MKRKSIRRRKLIGLLIVLAMVFSISSSVAPFVSAAQAEETVQLSAGQTGSGGGGGGGGGGGSGTSGGLKIESFNKVRLSPADTLLQFDFSNGLDRKLDADLEKIHVYIKDTGTEIQYTDYNYIKEVEGDTTQKLRRLELMFNNLEPETGYVLKFEADFEANNGSTLGQEYTYEFTTSEEAAEEPVVEEEPADEEKPVVEDEPDEGGGLTDIQGHWAEPNVVALVALEAISGYPDGTFRPDNNISRAEFATVLVKAFQLEVKEGKAFTDTADHWAKDFIATAAAHGIITGYSETTFGPDDNITREQMAIMIVKAAKLAETAESPAFSDSGKIADWAQQAVGAASGNKIITGCQDNTFRPQNQATRAEAATVIVKALN